MDVVARTGDYRGGMGNATGSSGRGQGASRLGLRCLGKR